MIHPRDTKYKWTVAVSAVIALVSKNIPMSTVSRSQSDQQCLFASSKLLSSFIFHDECAGRLENRHAWIHPGRSGQSRLAARQAVMGMENVSSTNR